MKWLKIVLTIAEYLIPFLGKLGKNKEAKKLEQATKVADTVMTAIEKADAKNVKEIVKAIAADTGVQDIVNTWVKTRIEPKIKAKLGL